MQYRVDWGRTPFGVASILVAALLLGLGSAAPAQAPASAQPLRVLLVTGGHIHDPEFYSLFAGQPGIAASVEPHPKAFTKNLIRDFDVIALYDMVQVEDVPEAQRLKLKAFAEAGKGIFVIHHALVSYQKWDWYSKELVGARYLLQDEPGRAKSNYEHDVSMTIAPEGDHPIVKGLKPFPLVDETYGNMQYEPGLKVLLRSDAGTADGHVAWLSPYPKSRVVVLQLGHDRQAHENPAFREIFLRCLRFSGGRL
ncbi:MAG: ThuA domain-containing protein [Bryobacterales bacterium]|nr:ThuA domain-containing protein [Bryobacterales bacterium]